jgi:hypothetical protein
VSPFQQILSPATSLLRSKPTGAGEAPASIIGRTCAFDAKNREFFEGEKVITAYAVRDKNFFKNLPILQKLPTDLIENSV